MSPAERKMPLLKQEGADTREGAARSAWDCMSMESGRAHTPSVLRRFDAAAGGLMPASASGGLHRGFLRSAAGSGSGAACTPSISRAWPCACPPGRTPIHGPDCLSLSPSGHPGHQLSRSAPPSAQPMPAKSAHAAHAPTAPHQVDFGPGLRNPPLSLWRGRLQRPHALPPSAPEARPRLKPSWGPRVDAPPNARGCGPAVASARAQRERGAWGGLRGRVTPHGGLAAARVHGVQRCGGSNSKFVLI